MNTMIVVNVRTAVGITKFVLGDKNSQGNYENCLELKKTSYGYDVVRTGVVLRPRRKDSLLFGFA